MPLYRRSRLGLCVGLILYSAVLFISAAPIDHAELKAKVHALVTQLGNPARQASAEAELLKLGPDILAHLPSDDAKLNAAQKDRLKAIRTALREAQVLKDLSPRQVSMQGNAIPLDEALEQLKKQTDIEVVDRREAAENPPLRLKLQKATFWQALDAIAKEADLQIALYERDGKVALREGPYRALPVSYSGVFRVVCKRIALVSLLETDTRTCTLTLEVSWEPRFLPIFLETRQAAFAAQDEKGVALKFPQAGSGRSQIQGRLSTEVEVQLEAPRRAVGTLGLLKGGFDMIGPSKMLQFSFDKLAQTDKKTPTSKLPVISQEGVTVRMRDFAVEPDIWTVSFLLEYPDGGPEFESFESWLVNNKIQLVNKEGRGYGDSGYEIDEQAGNKAVVTYRFAEEKGLVLGKPEQWKLTYRTPGMIAKVPISFEFRDLPLP